MDDPLSAVDPAVGRELFTRVVCGRLSGSTRILVTHQARVTPIIARLSDDPLIVSCWQDKSLEPDGSRARTRG